MYESTIFDQTSIRRDICRPKGCRQNILSTKRPVNETSCQRNVLSTKRSVDEKSCQRNVCRRKGCRQNIFSTKVLSTKRLVKEMSCRRIVLSTKRLSLKRLSTKCLSTKCLSTKRPSTKRPVPFESTLTVDGYFLFSEDVTRSSPAIKAFKNEEMLRELGPVRYVVCLICKVSGTT